MRTDLPLTYDEAVRTIYRSASCGEPWRELFAYLIDFYGLDLATLSIGGGDTRARGWSMGAGDAAATMLADAATHQDLFADLLPRKSVRWEMPRGGRGGMDVPPLVLGIAAEQDDQRRICLSLHRAAERPAFTDQEASTLCRLMDHIIEAVRLFASLSQDRTRQRMYAAVMDHVHIGVAIVDRDRRLWHSNRAGSEMLDAADGVRIINGRVEASYRAETDRLHALVAAALTTPTRAFGGTLPRPSGERDLAVMVRSVAGLAGMSMEQPLAAVFLRDMETRTGMNSDVLSEMFGFTASEVRLSAELAKGRSMEEAAALLGIRLTTARAHLRSIFVKTGVSRQSELMRILLI